MTMPVLWNMETPVCYAYEALNSRSSGLHGHRHFLLTFITRGTGIQTLNGKDIPFQPNDLFLLSPADFHKNTIPAGESFDYYGVKFSFELLDQRLSNLCMIERFPQHIRLAAHTASLISGIFQQLVDESKNGQKRLASHEYQQALVEQLFILAFRELSPQTPSHPSVFINRTLGYLYSHFSEPICVADAATYIGYTPNYFNTCFRQQMGVSFGAYLREMRMTYAENLLRAGTLSVTEVAMESGFGTLSHFSKSFCAKYGMSPQKYRKSAQEEN